MCPGEAELEARRFHPAELSVSWNSAPGGPGRLREAAAAEALLLRLKKRVSARKEAPTPAKCTFRAQPPGVRRSLRSQRAQWPLTATAVWFNA